MGLKIGVTGGIGSGKSMVCRIFKVLGIPVYDADKEAKDIMVNDKQVVEAIKQAFGTQSYAENGELNRSFLAEAVFNNTAQLTKLNSIVHPAVIQAGEDWAMAQCGAYSIKEAALLFESGSYKKLDYTILVTAPVDVRIQRVMLRDTVSREQVEARMDKQWTDDEKMKLADFVLVNDDHTPLIRQVMELHRHFISLIGR